MRFGGEARGRDYTDAIRLYAKVKYKWRRLFMVVLILGLVVAGYFVEGFQPVAWGGCCGALAGMLGV